MKKLPFVLLLVSTVAWANCPDLQRRQVIGKEPIASKLYAAAKHAKDAAWKSGFYEERFNYIGEVTSGSEKLYVTHIETILGPSCRATNRLIFFGDRLRQKGQYYGAAKPSLSGSSLTFPNGKVVDLSSGLPKQLFESIQYSVNIPKPQKLIYLMKA